MSRVLIAWLSFFVCSSAWALDDEAESFVRLALELGEYDQDYVDAYLGPAQWQTAAKENLRSEDQLASAINQLYESLQTYEPADGDEAIRHRALLRNVRAMHTRMRMVQDELISFADEALLLYDVELPEFDYADFDRVLVEIDRLLPGEGELADRVDAFRSGLEMPDDVRNTVIDRAIAECRRRASRFIELPESERFVLEYVTDQSWSGYNWYQGENESLMQINIDFPVRIDAAISLGCHEGYPGHHVWNVLVENRLLNEKGWIEHSIFPLFSPFALIAEGSAEYGISLAFPDEEKTQYERDVLFPLAGLDPEQATVLEELKSLLQQLSYARIATAQLYLDGDITREEAVELSRRYGLQSRARAEQTVRFAEQYRSYVLNYSIGQDIVRGYIERQGSDAVSRWAAFERMLTELVSASDMIDTR